MRMCTHGHQMMVRVPSKTINFGDHFVYNMHGNILDSNSIHRYNVQVFLSRVKATNKTTTQLTRSLITMLYID